MATCQLPQSGFCSTLSGAFDRSSGRRGTKLEIVQLPDRCVHGALNDRQATRAQLHAANPAIRPSVRQVPAPFWTVVCDVVPVCPFSGSSTSDRYEPNESFFYELMSIFRRGGPGRAFCAYALKARPRLSCRSVRTHRFLVRCPAAENPGGAGEVAACSDAACMPNDWSRGLICR
jgi:hypothetical protein